MRNRVKDFIEDYVDDIEKNNWELVFDAWYQETDVDEFWEDDQDFQELLEILVYVLDVDKQTLRDARAEIIAKYTEDIVNDLQHNYYNRVDSWNIYWSDVLMKLESLLGFSQEDIFAEIFNEVDLAGITPDYSKQCFVVEGL